MALENRQGVCATCDGPIWKYPHPDPAQGDRWAHLNTADWLENPHDPSPVPAAPDDHAGPPEQETS